MEPKNIIRKIAHLKAPVINEQEYTISGVFSTDDEDRHGEVVDQAGWKLAEFLQNPVILFAHDHYTPAVGKAIELGMNALGQLAGTIKFAVEEDVSGLARTLFNLYKGGFMRAFSVGFANDIVEYDQENDKLTLKENTLYEISCVNVPANAMALANSKGLDMAPLEELNKTRKAVLTEKDLESISAAVADVIISKAELSTDSTTEEKKVVETPSGRAGRVRRINKAIRKLVREKQLLKKYN